MHAVDTNVLVRFLIDDDPRQTAAARAIFSNDHVWIAKTVLLETEWVLRRLLKLDRVELSRAFTQLLQLPNVHVENRQQISAALGWLGQGLDFADALHVASKPENALFLSFDKSLVRRARKAGVREIEEV